MLSISFFCQLLGFSAFPYVVPISQNSHTAWPKTAVGSKFCNPDPSGRLQVEKGQPIASPVSDSHIYLLMMQFSCCVIAFFPKQRISLIFLAFNWSYIFNIKNVLDIAIRELNHKYSYAREEKKYFQIRFGLHRTMPITVSSGGLNIFHLLKSGPF